MRNRWFIRAGVALGAAVTAAFIVSERGRFIGAVSHQPCFAGKPASYWRLQVADQDPFSCWGRKVLPGYFESPWKLLAKGGREAVPVLAELLKDESESVRLAALLTLAEIGPDAETAIPNLTRLLKPKDFSFFVSGQMDEPLFYTCFALAQIGPGAVPALIKALDSPSARVRSYVAETLSRIGPSAKLGIPRLTELMLSDENPSLRLEAAWALVRIDRENELPVYVLLDFLESGNSAAQHALNDASSEMKRTVVVPALVRLSAQARNDPSIALELLKKSKAKRWPGVVNQASQLFSSSQSNLL